MRVPIGGTDFDLGPWAYNETPENDAKLSNFTKLDPRDLKRNAQIKELVVVSKISYVNILAVTWVSYAFFFGIQKSFKFITCTLVQY